MILDAVFIAGIFIIIVIYILLTTKSGICYFTVMCFGITGVCIFYYFAMPFLFT